VASTAGEIAGRYCVSGEEDYVLFSAGDFGGGEYGAVDFDVFGREVEEMIAFEFPPWPWQTAKSL
jgi:hypothetical protein